MKTVTLTMLTASALAVAACGPKAATTNDQAMTAPAGTAMGNDTAPANDTAMAAPAAAPGQAFANAAASSDAFEIASSEMAAAASASTKVKAFAARMIEAHNGSTAKLKTIASGLTPPITPDPALTPEQQAKLDGLKGKTGAAFDTAYAAAQVEAHTLTLDTLRTYAATGDVPALKTFASGLAPTVAAHLNMAKAL